MRGGIWCDGHAVSRKEWCNIRIVLKSFYRKAGETGDEETAIDWSQTGLLVWTIAVS